MAGRAWSKRELAYLKKHYGVDQTAEQIGERLGRTTRSVYGQVHVLGLGEPRRSVPRQMVVDYLRKYHPLGYGDTELHALIVRETGLQIERHRIGETRQQIGLSSNKTSVRQRERVRAKTQAQLRDAGLGSLAELRREAFRKWVRDLGWPDYLTVRAAQAAELFYRRGPMTRMQLCEAMGMGERGMRDRCEPSSRAKGGTVMAELMRAGLLMCLPKAVASGRGPRGCVRRVNLYLLNPGVMPSGKSEQRQGDEAGRHEQPTA